MEKNILAIATNTRSQLTGLLSIGGFAMMMLALFPAHAEEMIAACGNADVKAIRVQTPQKSVRPSGVLDPIITAVRNPEGTFLTVSVLSPEFDRSAWIDTVEVTCEGNDLLVSETFVIGPRVNCLSCSEAMVDQYRQPVQIDLVMRDAEVSIDARWSGHTVESPVKEGKPFTIHRVLHSDATLSH